jgi:hypothetical protein
MQRRAWMMGMVIVLAGCGGVRPTTFSDTVRGMAEKMRDAIEAKNIGDVDKVVAAAERLDENDKITKPEKDVLFHCGKLAHEGKWDEAKDLMESCLSN